MVILEVPPQRPWRLLVFVSASIVAGYRYSRRKGCGCCKTRAIRFKGRVVGAPALFVLLLWCIYVRRVSLVCCGRWLFFSHPQGPKVRRSRPKILHHIIPPIFRGDTGKGRACGPGKTRSVCSMVLRVGRVRVLRVGVLVLCVLSMFVVVAGSLRSPKKGMFLCYSQNQKSPRTLT